MKPRTWRPVRERRSFAPFTHQGAPAFRFRPSLLPALLLPWACFAGIDCLVRDNQAAHA